jgi:hypothetical protein
MSQALTLHPGFRCATVQSIQALAARPGPGLLNLSYVLTGALHDLHLPPAGPPARADELWRHTCFEAFVRADQGVAYLELNVSPSRHWAAYHFSGYRAGMRAAGEIAQPAIEARRSRDRYELDVTLDLAPLAELANAALWRLGLAAVIEGANGAKSYWALAHPPGAPDFHAARGFAYGLAMAFPS